MRVMIGLSITIVLLLLIAGVSIFRPIPIVEESEALQVEGYVTDIYSGASFDIVFKITGSDKKYYINRGLERGLEMDILKAKLLGKKVLFKYPKHWTPLDWNESSMHISKVETKNEIIFNELKGAERVPARD